VVSTAGAGDAHLAGLISGLVAGLKLPEAQQLGALVAAGSVTSPHTIHKTLDRAALARLAALGHVQLHPHVQALLKEA
jgi:sugar/nucleoside kinase (ribokinase family)